MMTNPIKPHEWQEVSGSTVRMAVPGGWLYRTVVHGESAYAATAIALAFVPDPRIPHFGEVPELTLSSEDW